MIRSKENGGKQNKNKTIDERAKKMESGRKIRATNRAYTKLAIV